MLNMIKAEFYRMTKSAGFYFFWSATLITFIISIVMKQPGGVTLGAPMESLSDFKMDIGQLSLNLTFYFLLIIPSYSIIAVEFSEHTIKNTISSAISKKEFFISKFVFTLAYSVLSYAVSNMLFFFANKLINSKEYSSDFGDFAKALLSQLPLFTAIVALFIFLVFLFRKGGAFNAVTIIFPILYTTVSVSMYTIKSTKNIAEKLLNFELSTMISKLALGCTDSYRAKCYIICALITILSFAGGYILFNKRELD